MAYRIEKNDEDEDIVFSGWELGIAPSPLKGVANIQNANISTDAGAVLASYGRSQQTMTVTNSTGTLTFSDSSHVGLSISGANSKFKGTWITVSSSSHAGELPNGNYWVLLSTGGSFVLDPAYNGPGVTGYTAGLTATIAMLRNMGQPVAWASESYFNGGTQYFRWYVLDANGLVWVYDSATTNDTDDTSYWQLPDTSVSYWGSDTKPSGLMVLNGTLIVMSGNKFWVKQTVDLGASYAQATNAYMMSPATSSNPHFGFVGHQGRGYYTDGSFVGSIFPDTSLEVSGLPNIQTVASYTTSTTTGTISNLYSGSLPSDGNITSVRVPAVFFAATGGSLPAALTANVVYYVQFSLANQNFQVFAASSGGVALDITTGHSGIQYFNTFWLIGTHAGAGGDHKTVSFSPQRLTLPEFEVATCMAEAGNTLVVGAGGNVLYPWNQVDATPSNVVFLPEAGAQQLLTVNQMVYVFAGRKGNIYITDGSIASLVLKVPDYCAGVPGTASSYYEPYFTWGGVMYLRGRVYFSILDQTSAKAGNCGGVWSFVPTQNLYIGQDTGLALRQENRSSYGTYNGYSTVLIPYSDQGSVAPQFWSGWKSSITSPTYGIDRTGTSPDGSPIVIETDLVPTGTLLSKKTFKQLEYKLSTPLVGPAESVALAWRLNGTGAYTDAGAVVAESTADISGVFTANFEKGQWLQLRATITPNTTTSNSFTPLVELRAR